MAEQAELDELNAVLGDLTRFGADGSPPQAPTSPAPAPPVSAAAATTAAAVAAAGDDEEQPAEATAEALLEEEAPAGPARVLRLPNAELAAYKLKVTFLDGVSAEYTVTEDYMVSDLVASVAESVGLLPYAELFHVVQGEHWLRLAATLEELGLGPAAAAATTAAATTPLVFRMRWFKIPAEIGGAAIAHQVYLHARRSVLVEDSPLDKRKAIQLAGLQLQATFGDRDLAPGTVAKAAPGEFFGASVLRDFPADFLELKAIAEHRLHRGKAPLAAEREYVAAALQNDNPMFGATLFPAAGQSGAPRRIAVLQDGIAIWLGPTEGFHFKPFSAITELSCDAAANSLSIVVTVPPLPGSPPGSQRPQETMRFGTSYAREIVDLAAGFWHLVGDRVPVPQTLVAPSDIPPRSLFAPHVLREELVPYASLLDMFRATLSAAFDEIKREIPPKLTAAVDAAMETPGAVLDTLDLALDNMDHAAVSAFASALEKTSKFIGKAGITVNFALHTLNISGNVPIGDTPTGLAAIRAICKCGAPIKRLHLQKLGLSAKAAIQIGEALRSLTQLEELNISNNPELLNQGVLDILKAIERHLRVLNTFACANTGVSDKALPYMAEVLRSHPTIASLTLAANKLGDSGAAQIATIIRSTTPLTELDLSECELGRSGCRHIAEALEENTVMRRLRIAGNKCGSAMPTKISQLIAAGKCFLNTIDVSFNGIGKDGCIEMLRAAKMEKSFLTALVIGGNPVPKKAERALADLATSQLMRLGLRACELSKPLLFALCDVIRISKTLVFLDLSLNDLHADVLPKLSDAVGQSSSLTELMLSRCGLNNKDFPPFISALRRSRTLARLHLDANKLGKPALAALLEALSPSAPCSLDYLSLCELETSEKELTEFVTQIPAQTKLATLDLRRNRLVPTRIAASITHLKKVNILL